MLGLVACASFDAVLRSFHRWRDYNKPCRSYHAAVWCKRSASGCATRNPKSPRMRSEEQTHEPTDASCIFAEIESHLSAAADVRRARWLHRRSAPSNLAYVPQLRGAAPPLRRSTCRARHIRDRGQLQRSNSLPLGRCLARRVYPCLE
jgi:hypothetical protein